jgi:cytoskeletal protein CcmA (bactofilin family)
MQFRGFTGGKDEAPPKTPAAGSSAAIPVSTPSPMVTPMTRNDAYIGKGSQIVGSLQFSSPVELDCHVEGEIEASDRLTIGEAAMIRAKIRGTDITIKGLVQGDVIATKRLTLKKPARIAGNISAPVLAVEEGVLFEGKCVMSTEGTAAAEQRPMVTPSTTSSSSAGSSLPKTIQTMKSSGQAA